MPDLSAAGVEASDSLALPGAFGSPLEATFEAVVFDWDGTAVPDRSADASGIRTRLEALSRAGTHIFVVSGTHVGNVDGQLRARPAGPGQLFLCLNRGSEVFRVGPEGPLPVWTRVATDTEDAALDRAAAGAVEALRGRGIPARIVSQRLNRRKIDLILDPEWARPPKARIAELLHAVTAVLARAGIADLAEVVAIAAAAASDAGLTDPRITSDVKHVEIGLTDKSDSARWAAGWLGAQGITGALVLVAGDEFGSIGGAAGSDSLMLVPELDRAVVVSVGVEPGGVADRVIGQGGGPDRFASVLDAQLARRDARRVPWIDTDPRWVVELPAEGARQRAAEALGTLGNGWAATRAIREEDSAPSSPPFAVSGIYSAGEIPILVPGPVWTGLDLRPGPDRRWVDLHTGLLARRAGEVRTLRLVSAADPHGLALRAEGPPSVLGAGEALAAPDQVTPFERAETGSVTTAATSMPAGGSIALSARDWSALTEDLTVVERLAAWAGTSTGAAPFKDARRRLGWLEDAGFDGILASHRRAWAQRWADAEVSIDGSPEDELAARMAVFHLLCAGPDQGEAAVGARGLTGPAYGGHVFWDADVFVLPALAALRPGIARAMLEYRIRRLRAAQAAAAGRGLSGARFPWESAGDGSDVTPRQARGPGGQVVAILTGEHEEHITADVAWAAAEYSAWTGEAGFLAGAGRGLVVDTARYWAGRARLMDGRAHIYGVMGPDEYHAVVDDNAYTNLMARANLRAGADLLEAKPGGDAERSEAAAWRELADALVDGYDPARGLYEQFAGYWALEPLMVADIGTPPLAADVVLGAERTAATQVIKQADVMMAHHLIPEEMAPGSLRADLDFYGPRTAHGSSLSPAIHACVLARDHQPDAALGLLRAAGRLDLDDMTGTTAGGLHLATFGGLWQALAYGFLGLRPHGGCLQLDPCLPSAWEGLSLRLRYRGTPVGIRADHTSVRISCDEPFTVRLAGAAPQRCDPPGRTLSRRRP